MNNRPAKKKPEDIAVDPVKPLSLSTEDWQEAQHGIKLFNTGKFWHAHEAWELVWQRQAEDERLFFQGLIQLAAAYHHLVTKGHRTGYANNLKKADAILRVFAPEYLGISVSPLLGAIEAGLDASAGRLGEPPTEDEFRFIPKIRFRLPCDPDLMAAVRTAIASGEFGEGVALFNRGYHWEAHDRWEDAMRDAEGDAKVFLEGLVQAAGGLSFFVAGKGDKAAYLFVKSVETLRRFGDLNCGLEFQPLVDWMETALHPNGSGSPAPGAAPPKITLRRNGAGGPIS